MISILSDRVYIKASCDHSRVLRGFALVEVMVSLVLIAVGLLGLAGLNAYAISNTGVSRMRSVAVMHAASLASAMSANDWYWRLPINQTIQVNGAALSGGTSLSDAGCSETVSSCSGVSCSNERMAACDLQQWGGTLKKELSGGRGVVNCSGGTPNVCSVTVFWWEKNVELRSTKSANVASNIEQKYGMVVQP